MNFYFWLITNSVMLGVGLAMDAFSVSLANGFAEPHMKKGRMLEIAGIYALFQFAMPVIGWLLVHEAVTFFTGFQKFIPWIALILLAFIGGKMLIEGIKSRKCKNGMDCDNCSNKECDIKEDVKAGELTTKVLMVQGIATSIDALSVGFTISDYNLAMTLVSGLIIGVTTYIICFVGLKLGVKFGTKLAGNAKIVGGLILIGIGIEIFIKGMLGI
ncbi:manganese efflux pump MntP [Butyrivibrio sp. AE2032]|uniref:manganese efflux pump MntP n=1 Tax=Butyrivibrio sp. AE2032 TaxID=1458463 RepID=UPI00054F1E89|nr:manganese efflux pump [Butyrivibrio sp. AE2032]